MEPIIERILDILTELDWSFFVPVNSVFDGVLVIAEVRNAFWLCLIDVLAEERQVLVHVLLPLRTPSERMGAMQEYAVRASDLMGLGGLVLDHDACLVRVKDGLDTVDEHLSIERLQECMERAILAADQHLPGLIGVMYQSLKPLDALGLVVHFPVDEVMNGANSMLRGG